MIAQDVALGHIENVTLRLRKGFIHDDVRKLNAQLGGKKTMWN